jgi:RNA polymerase sigma factor (sigma-70 family)
VDEIPALVIRAKDSAGDRAGRLAAFGELVARFQDMAYGYAYSILGDFHLAQDAAQEAFVQAWQNLADMREPAAFAGWLRRIVFKHSDRIRRARRALPAAEETAAPASAEPEPPVAAQQAELRQAVLAAVRGLPEPQREVTTLFYINGYDTNEIAAFLEVPVSTVKNRLHGARKRLRERMMNMVADELHSHGLPEDFRSRVLEQAFRCGDMDQVLLGVLPAAETLTPAPDDTADVFRDLRSRLTGTDSWLEVFRDGISREEFGQLLERIPDWRGLMASLVGLLDKYPSMARAVSRKTGLTPLHLAAVRPFEPQVQEQLLRSLLAKGADPNARAMPSIGYTPLHVAAIEVNLSAINILLDHGSDAMIRTLDEPGAATPLHWAAAEGQAEAVQLLLDRGVDPAVQAGGRNGGTPLHWAAGKGRLDVMRVLLDHSLDPNVAGAFGGRALHWAASTDQLAAATLLLGRGADVNARRGTGETPLHWAARAGHAEMVRLLLSHGADVTLTDNNSKTPQTYAEAAGHDAVAEILCGNVEDSR